MAQLNAREKKLAKRAGQGGEAFVLARRKRPGLTLLEYRALTDDALAELVESTAPEKPVSTTPKTTAAKKTAAKKVAGSSGRR